ncbi:SusC/RagA family TonB-linked outer membrane protein [Aureibaculum luteum]|uniref:SusC/RagA family TonB-linked outer membrane protein n=1 Tax=Aureibaculum luteum TaxID=1548456 RepID=UPI000E53EBA4|nr:SusC/RagA family TonB-linked outer membrane protein [Aureibaculum luteum]
MKKNLSKLLFFVVVLCSHSIFAQSTVTGTIKDAADGSTLPGVNIIEKGTSNGVTSDFDGKYSIDVSEGAVLQYSFIGYTPQEITVNNQTVINLSLAQSAEALDEVVITALGISREKKALGYAISELKSDDLNVAKETNVVNSLSGKVAGVVLTQSTSGPAGGTRVVIRGNNSITGNNQPLYVVDGVPIDNSGIGSAAGNGGGEYSRSDFGTGVSDINPEDIESMSILKGPNAAALYGSRASNGVIIITTKRGKMNSGLGVSISSSATFENPLLLPEYQNDYGRGSNGNFPEIPVGGTLEEQLAAVKSNSSWGPKFDGSQQLYYNGEMREYSAQPDNVKDFFRTGTTFTNSVTLSGGGEKSSVLFSYTHTKAEAIVPNSDVRRHNFNLRGYSKLTDKFTLDAKVTYFQQDANNRVVQGTEGLMAYVYGIPRNIDIRDMEKYQDLENPVNPDRPYDVISTSSAGGNPYWILNHDINEDTRTRVNGFAKINYEFTDYLSAFARVGTDVVKHDTYGVSQWGHHFQPTGSLGISENSISETNADFLFIFNKDISDKFNIAANFGGNHSYRTRKGIGISGRGFKVPTRVTVSNLVDPQQSYTPLQEKKVNSLYGSASFAYDSYLYLDLTGRNDWSSTLSADNRSYFYPSASLSFIPSQAFDFSSSPINFLKFRGSWAQVGNDTGVYQLTETFNLAANGYLDLVQISRPSVKYSPDLKPEQVTSSEVGLEFKMFNNRFFGDLSYYSITSKDLIFDVPVPAATGYSTFRENVGELSNKGFEILIGGTPVKTDDLEWVISANISKNENKLVSLIDDLDNFSFAGNNGGDVQVQATVGGGFGDIYGRTWKRVEEGVDAGKLLLSSEGRPQAESELKKLGNYQPDYVGGITNNINYKNLGLSFLIDFRIGGQVYSGTDAALDGSGTSVRTLQYRESGVVVDGVIANDPADPSAGYTQNTTNITGQQYWGSVSGITENYIYDQTNFRMREIALTYRIPGKILENAFIKSASINLIGRNLFFISKKIDNFDPESSYSTSNFSQGLLYYNLPTTRSIGLNLNIKF